MPTVYPVSGRMRAWQFGPAWALGTPYIWRSWFPPQLPVGARKLPSLDLVPCNILLLTPRPGGSPHYSEGPVMTSLKLSHGFRSRGSPHCCNPHFRKSRCLSTNVEHRIRTGTPRQTCREFHSLCHGWRSRQTHRWRMPSIGLPRRAPPTYSPSPLM